jgi:hypothetical protein
MRRAKGSSHFAPALGRNEPGQSRMPRIFGQFDKFPLISRDLHWVNQYLFSK